MKDFKNTAVTFIIWGIVASVNVSVATATLLILVVLGLCVIDKEQMAVMYDRPIHNYIISYILSIGVVYLTFQENQILAITYLIAVLAVNLYRFMCTRNPI